VPNDFAAGLVFGQAISAVEARAGNKAAVIIEAAKIVVIFFLVDIQQTPNFSKKGKLD